MKIIHSKKILISPGVIKKIGGAIVSQGYDNWLWTERMRFNPQSGQIFDPGIGLKIII